MYLLIKLVKKGVQRMKGNVKTQENETYYQNKIDVSNSERNKGITLVALVVTIVVDLVSYDKNRKYSNLVVFSL